MIGKTLGHYRILEEIGAGGMGVVYRAQDTRLNRDVALKVLPAGALGDDSARRRFHNEALALAKLNHPNIEIVYEFDTESGVDFLVMELIRGRPLSDKLAAGALEEKEVLRIGGQLARGLEEAHAQGVLHRDLKPSNLFLTPEGRLKILDFGLAKFFQPGDTEATQTISDSAEALTGTMPYMSPEQLRGEPLDARSDIYSAGVVLYELATGQRPFPEKQGVRLTDAILNRPAPAPQTLNPRITPGLSDLIVKAMDKNPAGRYPTAAELLEAIEGAGTSTVAVVGPRRPLLRAGAAALGVVLLLGLAIGLNIGGLRDRLGALSTGEPAEPGTRPVKARPSVAVLGFKNLSGQPGQAWLSTAFSEMLTTELAAGGQLRTVSEENVARMKTNLALVDTDSYAADTLGRIRRNLGADYVVLGAYIAQGGESGGRIRLDLRLQNARTGETLVPVSETGTEKEIFDLISKVGERLRDKLGVKQVSPAEAGAVRASLPSNAEAARLFAEGQRRLRAFDPQGARALLEKAIAADPKFALSHSALSSAWGTLGFDAKEREEAKIAFDLSGNLSREERLSVEGRYRETTRERAKAIEIYRTLVGFYPDSLEYGLRLASAQSAAGNGQESLATVALLRRLPAPLADDPRIDLAEANAGKAMSDYKRVEAATARTAEKAEARGERMLVALARRVECEALQRTGEAKQAISSCELARRIYEELGDRGGLATALITMGVGLDAQGNPDEAEKAYLQALKLLREIGNKRDEATALLDIAYVKMEKGNHEAAKAMFMEARDIYRQVGNKRNLATALGSIGAVEVDQGRLAEGLKAYDEALAVFREMGNKNQVALYLTNIALALEYQGELKKARERLDEALAILKETGDQSYTGNALFVYGNILAAEDDLRGARGRHEEALKIRNGQGEKGTAAESQLALAAVALEEAKPAEAEALLAPAIAEFEAEKQPANVVSAKALLARVLLAQGKTREAQKAIDEARTLAEKTDTRDARIGVALAAARVDVRSGRAADAVSGLERVLAEARRSHFVEREFEIRLALGEIKTATGKPGEGKKQLLALERDARARGFLLIAREARALAGHEAGAR